MWSRFVDELTFYEAQQYCQNELGTYLVVILNENDQSEIDSLVDSKEFDGWKTGGESLAWLHIGYKTDHGIHLKIV